MAFLYSDMTAPQRDLFDAIIDPGELARAARAGIGLDVLARSENQMILANVAANPETPPSILSELTKNEHGNVVRAAANNPNTPKNALLALMWNSPVGGVRANIAANKGIDEVVANRLLDGGSGHKADDSAIVVLASNPSIDEKVMQRIYNEFPTAHARLADNASTPTWLLNLLAGSESSEARISIASNPGIDFRIMRKLSCDKNFEVRRALAGNPEIPVDVQRDLAQDDADAVRSALSANNAASPAILTMMANNELNDLDPETFDKSVLQRIAANEQTSPDTLESIAAATITKTHDMYVLMTIAQNPKTKDDTLRWLFRLGRKEGNSVLMDAVLENEECPTLLLKDALVDPALGSGVHETAVSCADRRVSEIYARAWEGDEITPEGAGLIEAFERDHHLPLDRLIQAARSPHLEPFPLPEAFEYRALTNYEGTGSLLYEEYVYDAKDLYMRISSTSDTMATTVVLQVPHSQEAAGSDKSPTMFYSSDLATAYQKAVDVYAAITNPIDMRQIDATRNLSPTEIVDGFAAAMERSAGGNMPSPKAASPAEAAKPAVQHTQNAPAPIVKR